MEIVDEAIKCPICKKVLNSPLILPCGDSICKEHVSKKKQIWCVLCAKNHVIPTGGLASNNKLEKIIKSKIYFGFDYLKATESCKKLETILDEIDVLKQDPFNYIFEIIGELKREVDLKREEFKLKIDNEAEEMIKKLSDYEAECKINLKAFTFLAKANELEKDTKVVRTKLKAYLNDLEKIGSNENKWKNVNDELNKLKIELESKSNTLKQDLLLSKTMKICAEKSKDFIQISTGFIDSKIVDKCLTDDLYKLCEFSKDQTWSLLFRASEHGFLPSDFHSKCDNKPNTLTIIKSSNGNIFGGYTDQCWESSVIDKYKSDSNAFLFSLINLHQKPAKIKIRQKPEYATFCRDKYGPAFGMIARELAISFHHNQYELKNMTKGHSTLSDCYGLLNYPQGSNASNFLAGSNDFEIANIEVFRKN